MQRIFILVNVANGVRFISLARQRCRQHKKSRTSAQSMIELSARNLFKSTIHSTLFEPNDLQCDDKSVLVTPRNWERIEKKTSQEALKINVINFNVSTPTLVSLKLPFIQRMNYLLQRSNLENHQPANDAVVFHHLFTDKFIWFQACLTLRISP